jgi:phosphoribosylaminoimidazole-succinocarboxamide synthase
VPPGLRESDKLPEPIFTPSTKAAEGHDEPMPQDEIVNYIGEYAGPVRDAAIRLYEAANDYARGRGIIIADTKFEFGVDGAGHLLLIDEALTPDSSRFWPADAYEPGRGQASFDKQFVRDFLLSVPGWNKQAPAPDLPDDIVAKTAAKYREAFRLLTGRDL